MEINDTQESKKIEPSNLIELSNLPEELRQYIIYQMIAPHIEPYINKIKNIDNIFEFRCNSN